MTSRFARIGLVLLSALMLTPTAASAQFSDSYNFLKAVRDRDGGKATDLIQKGGPTLIDTADPSTGERAIHVVVKRRDLTWLGFLVGQGARIDTKDRDGNTPLMLAAQVGFYDGARVLLSRGAQVDGTNNGGETPLIRAVQVRDLQMVRLLVAAGANPKRADSVAGMSARDYAVRDGRSEAVLKLLDEAKPAPKAGLVGPK